LHAEYQAGGVRNGETGNSTRVTRFIMGALYRPAEQRHESAMAAA